MEYKYYDVIVLGGGVAGLSSAIYASRAGLGVLVIEQNEAGGKLNYYKDIENFPGVLEKDTSKLRCNMIEQAINCGVKIREYQDVLRVKLNGDIKEVITDEGTYKSRAIIIATGSNPKTLNVDGEKDFLFNGIHFCSICDGSFYKDKLVAVVGGGNSALEEALYLSNIADTVYIIHRRDKFRADKILQDKVFKKENIHCCMNKEIKKFIGTNKLTGFLYKNSNTVLNIDGVFIYVGNKPNTELFEDSLIEMESGFIKTDKDMKTSIDGVYAVGDVVSKNIRQVATAVSDGVIAGLSVNKYLEEREQHV